jgi:hypothetical protein
MVGSLPGLIYERYLLLLPLGSNPHGLLFQFDAIHHAISNHLTLNNAFLTNLC